MSNENLHFTASQSFTPQDACSSSPEAVETQSPISTRPLPHQSAVKLPSFVFHKSNTPIPRKVASYNYIRHSNFVVGHVSTLPIQPRSEMLKY